MPSGESRWGWIACSFLSALLSTLLFALIAHFALYQAMARGRVQIKVIEAFQFLDSLQAGFTERALAIEGMQHDALQQITQGQIVVVGEGSQDFQKPLLHAHAGLHPLNRVFRIGNTYASHMVPTYLDTKVTEKGWSGQLLRPSDDHRRLVRRSYLCPKRAGRNLHAVAPSRGARGSRLKSAIPRLKGPKIANAAFRALMRV